VHRALVVLLMFTALTGLVGGVLFVVKPDGSLLGADPALLLDTPFSDWFWPGMLLGILVGLGFLVAAIWELQRGWKATWLSAFAGLGLIAFVSVEFAMIGFHPLQVIYGLVGVAVIVLAVRILIAGAARRREVTVAQDR